MSTNASKKSGGIPSSKYKVSRRLMTSIWGHAKDSFTARNTKPGQHGASRGFSKGSDYGIHLKEKQKIKAHYGRTTETQMKNAFSKAMRMKGNSADNFISLLERRLYVLVYRLNFANTIFGARQLVSHKHVLLNGKVVNVASCLVKVGDVISLTESARSIKNVNEALSSGARYLPEYLTFEKKTFEGRLTKDQLVVDDIPFPFKIDMGLVVEFYSR